MTGFLVRTAALLGFALCVHTASAQTVEPFRTEVQEALWWGDFETLRRLHAQAKADRSLDEDGSSLQLMLSGALGHLHRRDVGTRYTQNYLVVAQRWVRDHPEEPLAHVMLLKAMINAAWFERGGGFANTVSEDRWKAMREHLQRALAHARQHPTVFEREVLAYGALISIGKGLSWSPEAIFKTHEAALKQDPENRSVAFDALEALLPKWLGDADWVDRLVRDVVQRTRERDGLAWYARLYFRAAADDFEQNLFKDSRARWPLMKEGFQRLLRDHRGTLWAQRYATIACIARDNEAYREALDALLARGAEPLAAEWAEFGGQRMIDGCQRWGSSQ